MKSMFINPIISYICIYMKFFERHILNLSPTPGAERGGGYNLLVYKYLYNPRQFFVHAENSDSYVFRILSL